MEKVRNIKKGIIWIGVIIFFAIPIYKFCFGTGPVVEGMVEKIVGKSPYIVEIEVKQSHLSLDIGEHMKDAINKFEFKIPVSKKYYESVQKGEELSDSFRVGSLLTEGSIGKWNVTIEDKYKQDVAMDSEYEDGKTIVIGLKQNHLTFNPFKYLKDTINSIEIDVDVNKHLYDKLEEGEVIYRNFRWGSLIVNSDLTNWEVKVKEK